MKIVRLIQEFPEQINRGLAPNVYYISKEQVNQGHEVWVFAFTKNHPSKEKIDGINIHRIKKPPLLRWFGGLAFFSAIKNTRISPDIVHGLQPISFGWLFPLARFLIKTKYILSIHCSIFPLKKGYVTGLKNKLQNFEFTLLCRLLTKKVDLILPVANFIKTELTSINIPNKKIKVIPSGINFNLFHANNLNFHKGNIFTILFVGRFVQMKGLPHLIKALHSLNKHGNFKLLLVGGHASDDSYDKIINMINMYNLKASIEIINTLPQDKIIKYYHTSNVFVLPSICEPRGKVILEAMASGLPVIATKSGGTSEIIKDKINGLLIPPKDSSAISSSILKIKKDNDLTAAMIDNGLETSKYYDWGIITKKYTNSFKCSINEK
jgi:glycosyltransferase involved in cell wall biosynthesis